EIVLLGIAAHVGERQDCDRRLVGKRQGRSGLRYFAAEPHPVDPHRPGDVLELLFAGILEGDIELASRIFLHAARNADPTRFREALQTGRHIHAVAVDVAAVDDDIADIDANTELDPPLLRDVGIALKHAALDLD